MITRVIQKSNIIIIIQQMSNERQMRAKRNSFIINMIETPNGFSIVQGTQLLNKLDGAPNIIQQLQPSINVVQHHNYNAPSKQYKPIFKKTNLVFLRKEQQPVSFICKSLKNVEPAPEHFITPSFCKVFAPWFDLNLIHELQKKEVTQWLAQKLKITVEEAQEREQLADSLKMYQEHRNFIVKIFIDNFVTDQKYLSANNIRKYLCCDAFWVMKLHLFLTNLGVINTHSPNYSFQSTNHVHILKTRKDGKKELLSHQLSTDISTIKTQEDQNQLLKKITAKIRPYCDYCRIHCGIVWFQHTRSLDPKEIANIMKNVNSKNPPLSQKQYEYVLCVKCYCQGHFPLLLTHHDFKKISVNDKLQPNKKKKNKRRKRDKRKREGEEELQQDIKENGDQERSHQDEEDEGDRKQQLNILIAKLINGIEEHSWGLQETNYLLELIQKHGEDWTSIHELLKKKGYAKNIDTEEIILYFLSLPRRGISKLREEYEDEQFIQSNFLANKANIGDRLAERKLNDSILFVQNSSKQFLDLVTTTASKTDFAWKKTLYEFIGLQKLKFENKLNYLIQTENVVRLLKTQPK